MHGLKEREKQILRQSAGIADVKTFHSALRKYFLEKTKQLENGNITVPRNTSMKMKKVKLSNRVYNSLTLGPTCRDNWGTPDINDIVSGFFVETFNINIDIFVLYRKAAGWRWTKNRNTKILISETGKITVFLLLNTNRDHFYALLPRAGIREIPMQYSFKEGKVQQTAGNTGYVSDPEGFNPNSWSSSFPPPVEEVIEIEPEPSTGKRKRQGTHTLFLDSSSSDSSSSDSSDSDTDSDLDVKLPASSNKLKL